MYSDTLGEEVVKSISCRQSVGLLHRGSTSLALTPNQGLKEVVNLRLQLGKLHLPCCRFHMHHHVVGRQLPALAPSAIYLPNLPPDPVTSHRATDFPGHRNSESGMIYQPHRLDQVQSHQRTVSPAPLLVAPLEFGSSS